MYFTYIYNSQFINDKIEITLCNNVKVVWRKVCPMITINNFFDR